MDHTNVGIVAPTTTDKITVCIVEDDVKFQDWILEELETAANIECLDSFLSGDEAFVKIPALQPDIVIMDLGLQKSKVQGVECMLRIRREAPEIEFLVLTANSNEGKAFEALRVGAKAYLLKGEIPEKLTKLLVDLKNKKSYMHPGIAWRVMDAFELPAATLALREKLTSREKQIMELVKNGYLNKEIADQLGIKEGTVKQHIFNIFQKLHVNNRVEAIKQYLGLS